MRLIEINEQVKEIEKAPHKLYIIEFDLKMGELQTFKLLSQDCLRQFEQFKDVDGTTNINILGIDGDKGEYDHSNVAHTHGIIMDFRPLGIYITYWDKVGLVDGFKNAMESEIFKNFLKGD